MTRPTAATGLVTAFDDEVGLGTVRTADGADVAFHCTRIADGSRHIDVGTVVSLLVFPGRHGRWEAGDLRPVAPGSE